jgi:hypothetical protein
MRDLIGVMAWWIKGYPNAKGSGLIFRLKVRGAGSANLESGLPFWQGAPLDPTPSDGDTFYPKSTV